MKYFVSHVSGFYNDVMVNVGGIQTVPNEDNNEDVYDDVGNTPPDQPVKQPGIFGTIHLEIILAKSLESI